MIPENLIPGVAATQASLFETGGVLPLASAAGWTGDALAGPLVVALCVVAVALVGIVALSGRLQIRVGMRVVLGSFILLGAPTIAGALMNKEAPESREVYAPPPALPASPPRSELPPVNHDPYAGASLRRR